MITRFGVIAGTASLTFVAGLVGGLAIGARRAPDAKVVPGSIKVPRTNSWESDSSEPSLPTGPDERREEIGPIATDKVTETAKDPIQIAREVWEMMTANPSTGRTKVDRTRFRELRPEMAGFFIRMFRESVGRQDASRQYALELAIACGGPEAAALVEELTGMPVDRHTQFLLRSAVAMALSDGHLIRRPREFPVGVSLMNRTQLLMASSVPEDRRLATAILGFADPLVAIPALTTVTRSDGDPFVRQAAIRELGRIGDAVTLEFLRSQREALAAEMLKMQMQKPPVSSGGAVMAYSVDTFSRPINDAIEELEERLQKK